MIPISSLADCLRLQTQASLEEVFVKVVMMWEEGVHGQSARNAFANPLHLASAELAAAQGSDDESED